MASKALDNAVRAVMDAMPRYGNRMTYADIKVVIGWPAGYYNITLLGRTLVERGLARSVKMEWDRLRHLELVQEDQREAARVAQSGARQEVPAVVAHYGHVWPASAPPAGPTSEAQRLQAARTQRLARLHEQEARDMEQRQALNAEIARQTQAAIEGEFFRARQAEERERQRREAEEAKAAFSAPVKGRGPGQAGPLADESTAVEAVRRAPVTLVLDDICGAEVYGAWGARKPVAN